MGKSLILQLRHKNPGERLSKRCWSLSQLPLVEGQSSSWRSHHLLIGPAWKDKQPVTFTIFPKDIVDQPSSPNACFFEYGRKPEFTVRNQVDTERTWKFHTEMTFEPCWEVTVITTAKLIHQRATFFFMKQEQAEGIVAT